MGLGKAPTVKSTETVVIKPESPTAPEKRHLQLTNLDLLEMRIFTPVILLYEAPANLDFPTVVGRLKESLPKALVEYYPFAGRFTKGEDGRELVRCDDAGAFFTEVVVEETLDEIGGFEGCVMLSGMEAAGLTTTGLHSLDDHEEIPPLVIQVTSFKCKSIALAVNWYHLVCDGFSGMTFLKAWSELARGLPITSLPDHRRHLLAARVPPQPLGEVPQGLKLLSEKPQEQEPVQESQVEEEKPCKKVEFVLSGDDIKQLKEQASGSFTSGECISAHLWRLVTKARALNREDTTTIFTIVDARKRMKNFPGNYFGNCIFARRADCTVGDVLDMPLGHLAHLIHDSVSCVTEEYVRSVVDYVEVTGASNLAWSRPRITTHDLQPTFWRFFPIYELDFGFGTPTYGGRNSPIDGSTGFAGVLPHPSTSTDGSVLVAVFLFPEAADDLATTLGL
ncbi:hypothetical protein KC19_7G155100 [Ceratodon purpureus]|uniref:Uncharacterized protein n=1 Tax=Ceratodon purpureus TaxID=3225 RepID=A0A8T0HBL2_CERPU|nr:hypothetical protein KC19_7G155100 [Ceratodon purpureus]